MTDETSAERFPTTRWSRVAAAGDPHSPLRRVRPSRTSARAYWFPLYAYIRRRGYGPHAGPGPDTGSVREAAGERGLRRGRPRPGRFRTFLRAVCDHFLANHLDRENAQKRGAARPLVDPDRLRRGRGPIRPRARPRPDPGEGLRPGLGVDPPGPNLETDSRDEYREAGHPRLRGAGPVLTDGSLAALTRWSPRDSARPRGPSGSPSTGCAGATANCSAGDRGHGRRPFRGRRRDPGPLRRARRGPGELPG